MAALFYHIDEIARTRKSDVLWIAFDAPKLCSLERMPKRLFQRRAKIISWLEQRKIGYEACFAFFGGALEEPYRGDLFIDLPINRSDQNFVDLQAMLEHSDGSPRVEGIFFYELPLKVARKNGRFYREVMNGI
jgi:hypothetical protein